MRLRYRTSGASLIAAIVISATGGSSADAQSDAQDAIAGCRALATETERLDCMEGLVLGLSSSSPPVETAAPMPSEASGTAPESNGDGDRRWLRLPFAGTRDEPSAEPAAPEAASYGSERLQDRAAERDRPAPMTARVVRFEEAVHQRLRVELDNGQVWEQRESAPPWRVEQYGAPDEVEIFPSRFGGYRMRLVGKNLTLSVERVR